MLWSATVALILMTVMFSYFKVGHRMAGIQLGIRLAKLTVISPLHTRARIMVDGPKQWSLTFIRKSFHLENITSCEI